MASRMPYYNAYLTIQSVDRMILIEQRILPTQTSHNIKAIYMPTSMKQPIDAL